MFNLRDLELERVRPSSIDPGILISDLRSLGLELDEERIGKLILHLDLMFKWNETYNLTALTTFESAWPLHSLDSLTLVPCLRGASKVIDFGTGAGLPGIPLAIALPDVEFVLLDSKQKRTAFLEMVRARLDLRNATVRHGRVETFDEGGPWDVAVCRAVAGLKDLVEMSAHLVRPGGSVVCMKGALSEEELGQLPEGSRKVEKVRLPRLERERRIVTIKVG